jgi:hypothetical protein
MFNPVKWVREMFRTDALQGMADPIQDVSADDGLPVNVADLHNRLEVARQSLALPEPEKKPGDVRRPGSGGRHPPPALAAVTVGAAAHRRPRVPLGRAADQAQERPQGEATGHPSHPGGGCRAVRVVRVAARGIAVPHP